ncbi:MAG: hypothetical protein WAS73_14370 [Defluviicoccus sp.]
MSVDIKARTPMFGEIRPETADQREDLEKQGSPKLQDFADEEDAPKTHSAGKDAPEKPDPEEDRLADMIDDSFPASDPPSTGGVTAGSPKHRQTPK